MDWRWWLIKKKNIFLIILTLLIFLSNFCYSEPLLTHYWDFKDNTSGQIQDIVGGSTGTEAVDSVWNRQIDCHTFSISGSFDCFKANGNEYFTFGVGDPFGSRSNGSVSYWLRGDDTVDHPIFARADGGGVYNNLIIGNKYNTTDYGLYHAISSNNNDWYVTEFSYSDDNWHCYVFTSNGTYTSIWIDGINRTLSYPDNSNSGDWFSSVSGMSYSIGRSLRSSPFGYLPDYLGEAKIFNETLNEEQIQNLCNYGNITAPPIANSSIDILFSNTTNPLTYKSLFNEGENFDTYINWTDINNNVSINNSVGNCSVNITEGIIENISLINNFSLCGSGCNYSSYNETFTFEKTNNAIKEYIHFDGCHEQLPQQNIEINISCDANSEIITVTAGEMPTCDLGTAFILKNTSVCTNSLQINASITYEGLNIRRKRIQNLGMDKEFSIDEHNTTELEYNTTTNLWFISEPHEFYEHGTKTVNVSCEHNTISEFNNNKSETITITNNPPTINLLSLTNILDTINLQNTNQTIEYADGNWNFSIGIFDDDIDIINYTIYNTSGNNIFSTTNPTPLSPLTVNGTSLFVDFDGNAFNISVTANDTFGNTTTQSQTFLITDTNNPTIVGVDDTNIERNTTHNWNANLTDEYLWEFNIDCDNGFNFGISEIARPTYNFVNQTTITNTTVCNWNISDGHTGELINDFEITTDAENGNMSVDDIGINIREFVTGFDITKNYDRYNFCVNTVFPETKLTIELSENCVEAKNSEYKGHYVCGNKWVDFEGKYPVSIEKNGAVIIDNSKHLDTTLCFNSIGILNTISGTQTFTIIPSARERLGQLSDETCILNEELSHIFAYFFMFIFIFIVLLFNELFFKFPVLTFFVGLATIYISFPIKACSQMVSYMFYIFALLLWVVEVDRYRKRELIGKNPNHK